MTDRCHEEAHKPSGIPDTLSTFIVDGMPDPTLFMETFEKFYPDCGNRSGCGTSRGTASRSSFGHSQGFGCGRQSEMERCAPSVIRRGPQTASVRFHNGAADG